MWCSVIREQPMKVTALREGVTDRDGYAPKMMVPMLESRRKRRVYTLNAGLKRTIGKKPAESPGNRDQENKNLTLRRQQSLTAAHLRALALPSHQPALASPPLASHQQHGAAFTHLEPARLTHPQPQNVNSATPLPFAPSQGLRPRRGAAGHAWTSHAPEAVLPNQAGSYSGAQLLRSPPHLPLPLLPSAPPPSSSHRPPEPSVDVPRTARMRVLRLRRVPAHPEAARQLRVAGADTPALLYRERGRRRADREPCAGASMRRSRALCGSVDAPITSCVRELHRPAARELDPARALSISPPLLPPSRPESSVHVPCPHVPISPMSPYLPILNEIHLRRPTNQYLWDAVSARTCQMRGSKPSRGWESLKRAREGRSLSWEMIRRGFKQKGDERADLKLKDRRGCGFDLRRKSGGTEWWEMHGMAYFLRRGRIYVLTLINCLWLKKFSTCRWRQDRVFFSAAGAVLVRTVIFFGKRLRSSSYPLAARLRDFRNLAAGAVEVGSSVEDELANENPAVASLKAFKNLAAGAVQIEQGMRL
ncbi:hypothetical protein B0H16DRAFT_1697285 [Mycena metata]|uniref:Uncharacterized protein n=1 Tax=Mycena metata TaxID=1033252 RepID=A0AAD7MRP0_9AGAR|nr:hypothetical protein B0H16DRAFT_1697285 [Mycena metata]